jgi:acyl-CoA oxidase
MNSSQLSMARTQFYHLLSVIRYEAVPLVDAFDFHDDILNSCLGRYDGDVYRHLYEWALKAPRNKSQVHETYEKYLKPLLKKTKSKL